MRVAPASTILLALLLCSASPGAAQSSPPYGGTVFLDADIIIPSDPSVYLSATYQGQGMRTVFDRRSNTFIQMDAFLFELAFSDGTTIEAQINPEFGSEAAARTEAETYGQYVGQMPRALRRDVDALWIHMGVRLFGGGNRSILIHTGQSDLYVQNGILEETLVHEAAHSSLDADHAMASGWVAAQNADPTFISTYARDNPQREDIAETFLTYLAVTYRPDRIAQDYYDTVTATIPNRIEYFNAQGLDVAPFVAFVANETEPVVDGLLLEIAPNPASAETTLRFTLDDAAAVQIDVFNSLGQRVQTLGRSFSSGPAVIPLPTHSFPTGVYTLRVAVGGTVVARAFTVAR